MKKVVQALVLCLFSPLAWAGGEDPAESTDDQWLSLDQDLQELAGALEPTQLERQRWGGVVRSFYTFSNDTIATGGLDDISGFSLNDVDLWYTMEVEDVFMRVSVDASSGDVVLEDAFATLTLSRFFYLTMGQFKARVTRSNAVLPESLLFKERTILGSFFDFWDIGAMISGHYDEFDYWLTLTNGRSGQRSDHLATARFEWALWDDAWADIEGARGQPNTRKILLGAFAFADFAVKDNKGDGFGADIAGVLAPWAGYVEWAHFDDNAGGPVGEIRNAVLAIDGDSNPWSATLSTMIGPDWQVAVRYQHTGNNDDLDTYGVALNIFPYLGAFSVVSDLTHYSSDGPDGYVFTIGVNAGETKLGRMPIAQY